MRVQWVSRPLWEKVVGGVVRVQWVSRPLWEERQQQQLQKMFLRFF